MVYKAEHPTLNSIVIIKKLTLQGNKDLVERFKREAQIMIDFRNEKIVQVYDHFKENNTFCIVMEYVDGTTLEKLVENKRFLSNEAAMLIFSEICLALKYAHDRQVIHRDIKPANILISKQGQVKLVDFGVSTQLGESDEDGLTKVGMTIGTPSYLAPEQIANAKNRDKRADIYSMGVMLYEMMLGKTPFRGGFTPEVISQIEKGKYTPPRKINPKIKPVINKVIKKAMHHKVRRRYQDLAIIIRKFSKYLRKYQNQSDRNKAIKLYLEGKEEFIKSKPKMFRLKLSVNLLALFLTGVVLLGVLSLGTFWAWQQGYYFEYLYPDQFGALRTSIKLRKGYKSISENYLKAVLYSEHGDKLVRLRKVKFNFEENESSRNKNFHTLDSKKIYLKEGNYVILLYAENEQYRENIYLYPRSLQKLELTSIESQSINFTVGKRAPRLPVKLRYHVTDINNGYVLGPNVSVSIFNRNRWVNWNDFIKDDTTGKSFTSGNRYRFRFQHDGYYPKNYNVTIRPEQNVVTLNLRLIPFPGDLYLRSKSAGVRALLNNSSSYISGGKERKYKNIKQLTDKYQKISLSPGEYFLSGKNRRWFFNSTSNTKKISINSGEKIYVTMIVNPDDQEVKFEIK